MALATDTVTMLAAGEGHTVGQVDNWHDDGGVA
jgi:hypothetical protein